MCDPWAIHIDIQGFSAKWNDSADAFRGLNALMQGIFWIGSKAYPNPPERLFAHQFGDGFLITSDFHEAKLDRAAIIAIALLRHVLSQRALAKATIAEGNLADIVGCYPPEIKKQRDNSNISFGSGIMTIFPVMGTALINAVKLEKNTPPGSLLTIETKNTSRLSTDIPKMEIDKNISSLNWLKSDPAGLTELQKRAGMQTHSESERIAQLNTYIEENKGLSEEWIANTRTHLL